MERGKGVEKREGNGMSNYARWHTKKKCPKCGSDKFRIEEFVETANIYEAEGGKITFEGTTDDADIKATYCHCNSCGYNWHPRKGLFGEPINQ